MTVIAGKYKGKHLFFVQNRRVRPITQKVREALFDIIQDRIVDAVMLDLFCGSGAVGIEALSRGAAEVDFVDLDTRTVVKNVKQLRIEDQVKIYRRDALKFLDTRSHAERTYDVIFIGAPYDYPNILEVLDKIDQHNILGDIMLFEHRKGFDVHDEFEHFSEKKKYIYGQTAVNLYTRSG